MSATIEWECEVCGHVWEAPEEPEPTGCPNCGEVENIKKKIPGLHDGELKVRP